MLSIQPKDIPEGAEGNMKWIDDVIELFFAFLFSSVSVLCFVFISATDVLSHFFPISRASRVPCIEMAFFES